MVPTPAAYIREIAHGGTGTTQLIVLVPTGLFFFASLLWQRTHG
jgi:hypothetical protein